MNGKQALLNDLYVVGYHLSSSKDRDVIRNVMNFIEENVTDCTYTQIYDLGEDQPKTLIGKEVIVTSDDVRIPKGTHCVIVDQMKYQQQYYIRNVDSEYCCWAWSHDLQFL